MFRVADYVVCPGHGVGQICDIETKEIGGNLSSYYIIKIVANGMKVMIPTAAQDGLLRELVSGNQIEEVFCLLQDHSITPDNSTWNRRYRDYMNKIKTGSLLEIADVLRSLFLLRHSKNLSFGEKKMLDHCKELLVKEIALSKGREEKQVSGEIDACFGAQ